MNKKIRNEATDGLFRAILNLNSLEECYTFFEDVCTINEIQSLSQRFEVAKLLREKRTYLEIAEQTGASTATMVTTDMTWYSGGWSRKIRKTNKKQKNLRQSIWLCRRFYMHQSLRLFAGSFFERPSISFSITCFLT